MSFPSRGITIPKKLQRGIFILSSLLLVYHPIYAKPSVLPLKFLGALPQDETLHLTVWLKLQNESALKKKIQEIYDPRNPSYQHFLTKAQFDKSYAPSPSTRAALTDYFEQHGFHVHPKNRFALELTGDVKTIEQLFHVKLNRYRYAGKEVYYSVLEPELNAKLSSNISEITGFSNLPQFKPFFLKGTPSYLPSTTSLNGFTGAELQTAYNVADIPLVDGVTIDGAGQTIVLVDGCTGATVNQLIDSTNTFIGDAAGLQPQLTYGENFVVMVNGHTLTSSQLDDPICVQDSGWGPEISLDVQASHTMAPGAKTVLVIDDQLDIATVIDTITRSETHSIAGFDNANVLSNSWGAVETSGAFPNYETALQLAAASGLSVNFSTGDCGDDTDPQQHCGNPPYPSETLTAAVNYPASSSWSTAVGGTSLFVDNAWRYAFETGWGNTQSESGQYAFYAGAGGGISQLHAIPSWQADTIKGFVAGGYASPIANYRALPDIAMLADNMTGLLIYDEYDCHGSCGSIGGTSLSSPLFAGVLTRINQARTLKHMPLLGVSASYLYEQNPVLSKANALNTIIPPHLVVDGALAPSSIGVSDAPPSSFAMRLAADVFYTVFSWDSSLRIEPSAQPWNDIAGAGSPNVPNFVTTMMTL